jgi:hypothetical protein
MSASFFDSDILRDTKMPGAGDMDFDFVTFLEAQCFDDGSGKADGEAIAPFGDLHGDLDDIRISDVYHSTAICGRTDVVGFGCVFGARMHDDEG